MTERWLHRRIRVRGRQREDIDLDLLTQALLSIAEDHVRQQGKQAAKPSENPTERHR